MNYEEINKEELSSSPLLKGGTSNITHLFQGHYVVRTKLDADSPFYSSFSESRLISQVEELGIGPKLYSIDKEGNSVVEKLDYDSIFSGNDADLKKVALSLKKLHSAKIFMKDFGPFARYRYYKTIARGDSKERDKNNQPKEIFVNEEREKQLILELEPYYLREKLVPCHNDLWSGNILLNQDGAKFIDYEFAGLNLKEFDLASILEENQIDGDKIAFLKEYYQDEYNEERLHLVNLFIEFENYLWYYWAKKRAYESKNEEFDKIAEEKLKKIENYAKI